MNAERGSAPIAVVGGGQAGMQVCDSLRKAGYEGSIILYADEATLPYQRPPLSKSYLTGDVEDPRLLFRPASYYEKINVEVRLGQRVAAIDRERRVLEFEHGDDVSWSGLALTTGTRVRPLPCPGADLPDVHYIRTLEDSRALRGRLAEIQRVVVIGGGFIGLEVAAVARTLGKTVTVIEALDRLMARAVSPVVSEFYASLHRERGVDVRLGRGVTKLMSDGAGIRVTLDDGDSIPAELVVIGIGVLPNVELAEQCGLECRNGIVVDAAARTSDPAIVAAGDCTMHHNGFLDREIRLESVQNAVDQAKVAALSLCGQDAHYSQVPWFWSDQYDMKMQMAGVGMPHDASALRGEVGPEGFSVFYFRDGALIGADSINRPADHMACRKLLAGGVPVSSAQAGDPAFDLMQAAKGAVPAAR